MSLPHRANLAISAVAGAMAPFAHSPIGFWGLGLASVIAFWYSLHHSTTHKQATWVGFAYGLGYFGVGVSWVYVSMVSHGGTHWLLGSIFTLLFCGAFALYYALLGALFSRFKNRHAYPSLLFIGLWLCLDLLRGWLFTGFPWLYLGYASLHTPMQGYAPIIGVHGVTLLMLVSALLIFGVQKKWPIRMLALVSIWLIGYGLSFISWTVPSPQKPITVTLLQGNVKLSQKWLPSSLAPTLGHYIEQSYAHLDSDLIIWPETAVATYWDNVEGAMAYLGDAAKANNTQMISGTVIRKNKQTNANYYNGLVAFGAENGQYFKQRLVPFGEYVPFESSIRGLIEFFDLPMSAFKLPQQTQGLLTKAIPIAGNICYEIAYPALVAQQAKEAGIIVTVSNDTWFERTLAPWQHLQMAQMRALENAKPVARATNSGVSALIDASGVITHIAPLYQQAQVTGEVTLTKGSTPYNKVLNWPVILLSLGFIFVGLRRSPINAH